MIQTFSSPVASVSPTVHEGVVLALDHIDAGPLADLSHELVVTTAGVTGQLRVTGPLRSNLDEHD